MKTIFTLCCILSLSGVFAQAGYETTKDPNDPKAKILVGTINKTLLQNDTAFKWYASSQQIYKPEADLVAAMEKVKSSKLQLVIFGGTWCEDTQFILPKFFKLQEAANVPDDNITLFGVTRNKITLGHIAEAFGIVNVPTIIVMKDGKELGRVVEYGKTGKWDQELTVIISKN